MTNRFPVLLAAATLALAACGGNSTPAPLSTPSAGGGAGPNLTAPGSSAISHVVIIVQENRSFDNLFHGFPGADTANAGLMHDGTSVPLAPTTLEAGIDLGHFHYSFEAAYDAGKLDGFDLEGTYGFVGKAYEQIPGAATTPYAYITPSEIQPYWMLAQTYTLADRMFQSNNGPSFPAHQYLLAAQSDDADEVPSSGPWGCDAPPGTLVPQVNAQDTDSAGIFPCFSYTSLANGLDAAGESWREYAPPLASSAGSTFSSGYDAISSIRYGPDWTNGDIVSPETNVISDVAAGKLANVTWVLPSFQDSDHPLGRSNSGPSWVSSVVNAIGTSPFWNSTAIFIVWDDWGGWYDHVTPPQLDTMGLGFRVPLIVVSPYAKHGYVSHQQHEFGSILRFTEETFGLAPLSASDARADDLRDCFDFTQAPQPFSVLRAPLPAAHFVHEIPDGRAPDPA